LRAYTFALFAISAVFIEELAAPGALVCGLLALWQQRRMETAVLMLGGFAYLLYDGLHAMVVAEAMQVADYSWPHSWVRWLGWSFVLQTVGCRRPYRWNGADLQEQFAGLMAES
jgi:hypothetical protein